jgi:hypothetical protein
MAVSSTLQVLGIKEETELGHAGSIVASQVKDYIQKSQSSTSDKNSAKEEEALKTLYELFFEYTLSWVGTERKRFAKEPNHPRAMDLRKKAGAALSDLQKGMIKYALCYMRLSRSTGIIQNEIEITDAPMEKGVEWTAESGILLGRFRKEKIALEAANKRLNHGITLIEPYEADWTALEEAVKGFFSEEAAEELLRPLRSNLRTQEFPRAEKALAALLEAKPRFGVDKAKVKQAFDTLIPRLQAYIAILKKEPETFLGSEGKLFLRGSEMRLVVQPQEREIEQRRAFINKYHQPYLHYKKASLFHLREKLLVIGSIESLMTLYIRMMRGFALPIKDEKSVREYEHNVLENIDFLMGGQFQEIDRIEERNKEAMEEFRQSLESYKRNS